MQHFLAFLVIAALLTLTPGADTAFVSSVALRSGRRDAFHASLGIQAGTLVHATASAVGLALILARSAMAFTALKLVGAAYLVFLGVRALLQRTRAPADAQGQAHRSRGNPFLQGFLTNVLNPKVAIFYLTFLPQFISPDDPVLAVSLGLALIHDAMGMVQLNTVAWLVDRAGRSARGTAFRTWMGRTTGAVMVAFGLKLALDQAPAP